MLCPRTRHAQQCFSLSLGAPKASLPVRALHTTPPEPYVRSLACHISRLSSTPSHASSCILKRHSAFCRPCMRVDHLLLRCHSAAYRMQTSNAPFARNARNPGRRPGTRRDDTNGLTIGKPPFIPSGRSRSRQSPKRFLYAGSPGPACFAEERRKRARRPDVQTTKQIGTEKRDTRTQEGRRRIDNQRLASEGNKNRTAGVHGVGTATGALGRNDG